MEFTTILEDLHTEAICPICLEHLKNPVTINCGHNFCLSCISVSWKDLKDSFPCPFCHFYCRKRKFRNNYQLGNLTEIAKLLPLRRSKRKRREGKFMCEKHKQGLTFFCQKDLEVLCPQCSYSTDHQNHYVWPVEKAALYHRNKLECYIDPWRERVEQIEKLIRIQSRKSLEVKKKVEHRREELRSEFEQIALFLQNEHENALRQLRDEEMTIAAKLQESLTKLSDHASSLKYLLKEIESKYVKSDTELLASFKSISHRYKTSKCPETFSFKLKDYVYQLPPQYSSLNRIIKQFQVDIVLDPETAHRKLTVSEDRKSVQYGSMQKPPHNPKRFYLCPAVLGSEGFNSGRQYWQVEVKDKPEWVVGVCKESLSRRRRRNQSKTIVVQDGLWGIGRCNETRYVALGSKKISLLPKVTPNKIGIFLDSEMGEVSFYNMDDRALLHTFNDYFTETLWPYFYTGTDSKPLKICTVTDSF